MAIKEIRHIMQYQGLSSDAKPTLDINGGVGGIFFEIDTGNVYDYTASGWVLRGYQGHVGGKTKFTSASFARPADTTPYLAYQVVSNSKAATTLLEIPNVGRVPGGSGYIIEIRLTFGKVSIVPRVRIHFFSAADPSVIAADGALWKEVDADASKRLGCVDMPAMSSAADAANSNISRSVDNTVRKGFQCAAGSTSIWAAFETLDGFTPSSGMVVRAVLGIEQN